VQRFYFSIFLWHNFDQITKFNSIRSLICLQMDCLQNRNINYRKITWSANQKLWKHTFFPMCWFYSCSPKSKPTFSFYSNFPATLFALTQTCWILLLKVPCCGGCFALIV